MDDGQIDYEHVEGVILNRLCEAGPMALSELVREFGDVADDCAQRLRRRGLAHRIKGGFLIASAAGRHANHLDDSWR